jgi:hypothetical protein
MIQIQVSDAVTKKLKSRKNMTKPKSSYLEFLVAYRAFVWPHFLRPKTIQYKKYFLFFREYLRE